MGEDKNELPLASEMYADLKKNNEFLRKLLVFSLGLICILIVALSATNLYHIYKWSRLERIVVDSEQGNANYVQGDNTGGIFNGSGYPEESGDAAQVP